MDAGFEFVNDAKVIGVLDDPHFSLGGAAHDVGGLEITGAKSAEANAGEIHGEGDGKEGHGSRHGETRLQHGLANGAEGVGEAGAEGDDVGGEDRLGS